MSDVRPDWRRTDVQTSWPGLTRPTGQNVSEMDGRVDPRVKPGAGHDVSFGGRCAS